MKTSTNQFHLGRKKKCIGLQGFLTSLGCRQFCAYFRLCWLKPKKAIAVLIGTIKSEVNPSPRALRLSTHTQPRRHYPGNKRFPPREVAARLGRCRGFCQLAAINLPLPSPSSTRWCSTSSTSTTWWSLERIKSSRMTLSTWRRA